MKQCQHIRRYRSGKARLVNKGKRKRRRNFSVFPGGKIGYRESRLGVLGNERERIKEKLDDPTLSSNDRYQLHKELENNKQLIRQTQDSLDYMRKKYNEKYSVKPQTRLSDFE